MSLLAVGSVAFDTLETPSGRRDNILGGSGTHFAFAASHFTEVRLVAVVGDDFPAEFEDLMRTRPINLEGLQQLPGKSFRWHGRYTGDLSVAETVEVQLNLLAEFEPSVPPAHRTSRLVFLANGDPKTHLHAIAQLERAELVMCDTMDLWINNKREELTEVLEKVDALICNDQELCLYTGEANARRAERRILALGPRLLIVKAAQHGARLVTHDWSFFSPAFPVENVIDPTGAGDSFAGGLMGYLASCKALTAEALKRGLIYGNAVASLNIEGFGIEVLLNCERARIDERFQRLLERTHLA